jgi:ABC-2 type transport system permease protein
MFQELSRTREVLSTLVEKDFKSRYKAKALGRLWSVADPMFMMVIYTIAFVHILQVGEKDFTIFLLLGLTPYRLFSNSVVGASSAVMDNISLVKRVRFPRILLPLAVVFSHVRHFFIELVLLLLLFLYFPDAFHFSAQLLWLPVLFAVEMVFTVGLALVVAALNVRYRDTQYILNSGLLILTWLTPIFYPFKAVPAGLSALLVWNPLVGVVEGYRAVLLHGLAPNTLWLAMGTATAVATLGVGVLIFKSYENVFADYL